MDYKTVLRLHYAEKLSGRAIAEACGCGRTAVNDFLKRFRENGELSYPLPEGMTNEYIATLLYKRAGQQAEDVLYRPIDTEEIHRAMAKKGETLKHLWRKYNAVGEVDGRKPLSYRQFCRKYAEWLDSKKISFHIQRYPGVNIELDFAGKTLLLHNRNIYSETTPVTIFIATLSYSDYFYVEGMTCCDVTNWIRVNNNALEYFGGVTQTVTPDNCKVAVIKNSDWIDPVLNPDFKKWAEHNGTVLMPAKVKSPRWKPNVENHVKIVTMHILVEMEEMTFFSLEELNKELWKRMDAENEYNFSGLGYSRRDLFEREEKDALLPLPESKYEYMVCKTVKVNSDFSFTYDKVHYTMPRKYLKKELDIRVSEKKIYVYNKAGDLVRVHERSYTPKSWVVIPSDMPKEYGDYGYWNVPYFLHKAAAVGPETKAVIEGILNRAEHPVQSFRSCFGILKYAEKYGKPALESCCHDAILHEKCTYTYIANTIKAYTPEEKPVRTELCKPREVEPVTGTYKDDDSQYSLSNLLKRQGGES